jgi:hypothetical protein
VIGIIFVFIKKDIHKRFFLVFFVLSLLISTLLVRVPTERYLVSFLPFLVIPASCLIFYVLNKSKILGVIFMIIIFILPFSLTMIQVISPAEYILLMGRVAPFNDTGYLQGFTSGYAVDEAISYFQKISENKKIIITIGENTGNPESAIIVYFLKSTHAQVVYFDSRLFGPSISQLDCFKSDIPLYFVSREEQLVGLDRFFQKIKTIKNPYGINTIGIYTLKNNCRGRTFNLQINPT